MTLSDLWSVGPDILHAERAALIPCSSRLGAKSVTASAEFFPICKQAP